MALDSVNKLLITSSSGRTGEKVRITGKIIVKKSGEGGSGGSYNSLEDKREALKSEMEAATEAVNRNRKGDGK